MTIVERTANHVSKNPLNYHSAAAQAKDEVDVVVIFVVDEPMVMTLGGVAKEVLMVTVTVNSIQCHEERGASLYHGLV